MLLTFLIYTVLFLLAIPWYWAADDQRLLFGFPLWVSISIIMSFFISCYTAYLLLKTPWPGEENE